MRHHEEGFTMITSVSHELNKDFFPVAQVHAQPLSASPRRRYTDAVQRADAIAPCKEIRLFKGSFTALGMEVFVVLFLYGLWEILHFFR